MPRSYAKFFTRIWHNDEFLALTSGAQRMYLLCASQDTLNLCGVTTFTPRRWSKLAKNTSPVAVRKDLAELAGAGFVMVDNDTEEVWITAFLKWDGVLDTPNSVIAMSRDYETVRSARMRTAIVDWFRATYPDGFGRHLGEVFTVRFPHGIPHGLAHGFLDGIGEPIPHGLAHGSGARARARTEVPVPSPKAEGRSPNPPTGGNGGDDVLRTETGTGTGNVALARRIAKTCKAHSGAAVAVDAAAVTAWALHHVDPKILEEAIGWAEGLTGDNRLTLPRALASTIQAKARDRNIIMPAYDPQVIGSLA